jgi:signal transduction histidine kinase
LGDRESITQIFINLLDNAIKYNKPYGHIYVKSYVKDKSTLIEIKDSGIGISEELREKVFEPFYRIDKDRSRETGGTGLGLALVKKLVEAQKGTIKILNTADDGTTFQIVFPIFI